MDSNLVSIGQSVVIKGQLTAREDLTIDGRVEDGKVEVPDNVVTVGVHAQIAAEIIGRSIVVLGTVTGNVRATERVEIRAGGSVQGDIVAPRFSMADGAQLRGRVETVAAAAPAKTALAPKPAAPAPGAATPGAAAV